MRSSSALTALILVIGCSSTSEAPKPDPTTPDDSNAGAGVGGSGSAGRPTTGVAGTDGGEDPPEGSGGAGTGEELGDVGSARQLSPGATSLVGVTRDGWAIFRDAELLRAAKIGEDADVETVSEKPGSVIIKGGVVFNWSDVDWEANIGDLSIWSHDGGRQTVGPTRYSEGLIAASESGSTLVYTANTEEETTDLLIAGNDLSSSDVLIEGMGLASETTCSPSLGFVGERLFVGWCKAGKREGKIQRFEHDGEHWQATDIAKNSLPTWSTDVSGDRILWQSDAYEGYYSADGEDVRIDASVSRAFLLPDASAALYTVGDQLRRTALPEPNPVPIVTTGYAEPVAFTPNYDFALYSSKVTYENGTQRDLRLVPTDGFNPEPIELVADPVATMPRSAMTADGQFVLYLSDVTPRGGDLHVIGLDGEEKLVLPNVLEAVAASGSTIIYSSDASDPEVYPVVSDLHIIDLATGASTLIEARILDGKGFQVEAGGGRIVYLRSGVDRDVEEAERTGLFYRDLP